MSVAIYSCVTNSYDDPPQRGMDALSYTDDDGTETYYFRPHVAQPRRVSYWMKYHPQDVLPPHVTHSVWVDGNITITNPDFVGMAVAAADRSPIGWAAWKHPSRDCVYQELGAIIDMQLTKWPIDDLRLQVASYAQEDYPEHRGLYALGCIARRHHDPVTRDFDRQVWGEQEKWNGSMDQIVVPYVEWKQNSGALVATFDGGELTGEWIVLGAHAEWTRYDGDGRLRSRT